MLYPLSYEGGTGRLRGAKPGFEIVVSGPPYFGPRAV